jgi:hypothetical protein
MSLTILEIILIATSSLLAIASVALLIYGAKRESQVRQLTLDKAIIMTELAKIVDAQSNKGVEETEGFLKFVSDSREWAFQYIEDVQNALEEYRQIADIIPISKDMTVEQAEKLSAAYDRVMSFLPADNLV